MSAKLLRRRYAREFGRMERYSKTIAWAIVISFIFQMALAVGLGAFAASLETSFASVFSIAMFVIFIGTRLRALNNIVHECTHATFAEHREDNATIGKFCAAILLCSFETYREEHLTHHMHLGDYQNDLDFQSIERFRLHEPLSLRVIARHIFTPLVGMHLPYYLSVDLSARDGRIYQILKFGILGIVAVVSFLFPVSMLFLIVPFVMVFTTLNYWADCIDHAGIVAANDDLEASRNVRAAGLLRLLFFPRNDCFHLVHHLFPHIPARHLPQIHSRLLLDDLYRTRPNANQNSLPSKGQIQINDGSM
ncbi:MAG: fatty acid desaturase family protein [Boseongicola sp.]